MFISYFRISMQYSNLRLHNFVFTFSLVLRSLRQTKPTSRRETVFFSFDASAKIVWSYLYQISSGEITRKRGFQVMFSKGVERDRDLHWRIVHVSDNLNRSKLFLVVEGHSQIQSNCKLSDNAFWRVSRAWSCNASKNRILWTRSRKLWSSNWKKYQRRQPNVSFAEFFGILLFSQHWKQWPKNASSAKPLFSPKKTRRFFFGTEAGHPIDFPLCNGVWGQWHCLMNETTLICIV